MEQFFAVLNQIIIFLILILLGILAVKTSILDEQSLGNLSKLVMRMALPAYIFINTAEGATKLRRSRRARRKFAYLTSLYLTYPGDLGGSAKKSDTRTILYARFNTSGKRKSSIGCWRKD